MSRVNLYKDRNLHIVFGVTLMAVLGVSSITPAFPKIVEELNIANTQVGLLITAFTLPGVILIPFVGILADRYGRRRILVPSLFLFGLAGGACLLIKDFNIIIIFRVIQGVGAASLGSLNMTILGDLYTGEQRAGAMGLNASVLGVGVAAYPLIGGVLATLAWNYPFFLPLAAIPVGFLVMFSLNNPEPRNKLTLRDYLCGVWGYLKNIRIIGAFMAVTISFILIYGPYMTYLSLFLNESFNASPVIIGGVLASYALVSAAVSSQLGKMVRIITVTDLSKLGFVLQTLSLVMLPFMTRVELVLIPTFIYGLGGGIVLPSIQTYVAGVVSSEYRAAFMSIYGAMLRLGQTLGPLVFGLVYVHLDFVGIYLIGAGLALMVAVVGFIVGRVLR